MADEFEDTELAALEQRLREAGWISDTGIAFQPDELAMAAKLLGSEKEAAKLNAAQIHGGRYRYRPQTISKVEVFYVGAADGVYSSSVGWNIDVIQNGRRRNFARLLDDHRCAVVLAKMEELQYRVSLVITEGMRAKGIVTRPKAGEPVLHPQAAEPPRPSRPFAQPRQERSKRFAMMEELRGFTR